ncbi:unnamed protein product [Fraxinus pennsylvanica]|uniref:POX domain-containing protein n=1 Tax=Fraxinus pennsylvanica TaxID=56036 RepID=A0AAD2ABQ3_9LAMI|nr:unnamed protein product [Fraxinus pennsylvanica]
MYSLDHTPPTDKDRNGNGKSVIERIRSTTKSHLGLHKRRLKLPVDAHKALVVPTNDLPMDSDWRDHGVKDQFFVEGFLEIEFCEQCSRIIERNLTLCWSCSLNLTIRPFAYYELIDGRYTQYCEQMQAMVNSFELVIGNGAAMPYTELAQKAMSRHFRGTRMQ